MEYNDLDEEIDGLIQRIQVRNFLCHDNLIIDFHNNNINWVYGRNGSGKSAIVTALVVGLGGKAAATRRGHNIQSFIKKGSNFAVLEIKIKNSTQKSYNHEIYGDHITVVRRITTSGVSSYMVKAATGEVISTRYAEISNIMLALEIQVDNPISVLNQDDARTFSSIDPKKMFTLFRRATNLDSSETNYKIVLENCNTAIAIKTEKERTCGQLEREFKNWQNKHRQLSSRDEMKKQIQSLKNEMVWSEIAELQLKQQSLNEQIQQQTRKCQKISERLASMENDFTGNRSAIETLKQRLEENNRAKTTLEEEKKTIEQEIREAQAQHHSAQRATAKKREQLDKETRKMADFEHEITNIESGAEARRRDELERRAGAARDAERAAGAREATAEHRLQQAAAQLERAQALAAREDAERRDLLESFEKLRRSQQELKSRDGDPLVVWGQEVVQLRRRVQQAVERHQFSKPPLGPVGFYLRLKDQKWGNALEYIIGNMKTTFCVNSQADSRKLFEIIQEVYGNKPKPSVTCSRFLPTRHDVSGRRVRAQPCALDVLDIQDPVIANFLIDNLSLETVLLAADQDEAIRKSDTEANVPMNCSKIVTEDCMEFYPAPNYRSYGRDPRRIGHDHYLHLSTEDGERRLREAVAGAEAALRSQEQRARAARADEQRAAREAREAGAALQALRAARLDCEAARREAERARDRHRSPQHDELEKELTVTRQVVEGLRAELNETSTVENSFAQKIDESERKLAQIKTKLQKLANVSRKLCEEITQEQLKVDSGMAKCQNYERVFNEYQDSLVQMRDQHTQQEAVITEKVNKALATGTRVDNPRNRRTLEELLQETRIKLRAADSLGLDVETVNTEMARAETEYRSLRDLLNSFGELIDETRSSIETRLKFCYQLEIQITRRVNFCFGSILATRGYNGRLRVEHSSGELTLLLWGRDGSRRANEAVALSGGERSYCTVALLLALWECVELPFYFLDEFDVFMDPLNRKLMIELLLDFARRHPSRQFVFLAPDQPHMDALSGGLVPQLHRLEDPRP
ncbi:structural maintenance of chromosomes protein 6 isoform X2 [Nymphalis io]|uniref:structural maintenance of chromosomes protein 6 isoform X2 n=1 Tax=Inachis io TaxID=171585 RepID=UPI00216833AD|nr:structural maintenance of chromosomes protein 6 isoform X2 [Nymphalis io]